MQSRREEIQFKKFDVTLQVKGFSYYDTSISTFSIDTEKKTLFRHAGNSDSDPETILVSWTDSGGNKKTLEITQENILIHSQSQFLQTLILEAQETVRQNIKECGEDAETQSRDTVFAQCKALNQLTYAIVRSPPVTKKLGELGQKLGKLNTEELDLKKTIQTQENNINNQKSRVKKTLTQAYRRATSNAAKAKDKKSAINKPYYRIITWLTETFIPNLITLTNNQAKLHSIETTKQTIQEQSTFLMQFGSLYQQGSNLVVGFICQPDKKNQSKERDNRTKLVNPYQFDKDRSKSTLTNTDDLTQEPSSQIPSQN